MTNLSRLPGPALAGAGPSREPFRSALVPSQLAPKVCRIRRGAQLAKERKGNVLFNDALNTFYLRLYGVGHMVKDHSDSERGNPLPPHGLRFPISSKGSFICIIPHTG